jgi:hypothetical protein
VLATTWRTRAPVSAPERQALEALSATIARSLAALPA